MPRCASREHLFSHDGRGPVPYADRPAVRYASFRFVLVLYLVAVGLSEARVGFALRSRCWETPRSRWVSGPP